MKILNATLYVKKIVSLNPDRHEFIKVEDALDKYHKYLCGVCQYPMMYKDKNGVIQKADGWGAKGFEEWCMTEI